MSPLNLRRREPINGPMCGTLLSRLVREERGAFLVEILVSALLLVLLTGGVMLSFDVATRQSGHQRAQAIAANFAQSEIDRIRSLKFASIVGLDSTLKPDPVDGIQFTVKSRSEAALAPNAAGSGCNTSARSPEAMKITTTVTWTGMRNRAPITVSSLVAAPSEGDASRGSFVVQIVNKLGYGVPGINVDMVGRSNVSGATDANGCVRFTDMLPQSGYRLKFVRPGWYTTPDFRNAVDDPVDIVAAQTGTKTYQYDPGGPLTVQFFFKRFNGTTTSAPVDPVEHPSAQRSVSWEHPSLSGGPVRKTVTPGATEIKSDEIYSDQSSPFGVYAGDCNGARPPAPDTMQPTTPKRLQVPSLDVVARNTGNASLYGITGCTNWNSSANDLLAGAIGPRVMELDPRRNTGNGNNTNWMRVKDAGWPYGNANYVCVRRKGGDRQYRLKANVDNRPAATNAAQSTIVDLGDFGNPGAPPNDVDRGYDTATTLCGQNVGFNVDNTMP